ncbi:hypothetical protein BpHYR1_046682 [Brachionus plicatilis]|uniref:Uncharacterized protein n=1 Tax=Brachionus plicatilis TaxID=10195 RepID=A0A3M7RVR9_BRAPC|nr:hypothetical protein BpHYR1_046682 [Brachionus plicatilis]
MNTEKVSMSAPGRPPVKMVCFGLVLVLLGPTYIYLFYIRKVVNSLFNTSSPSERLFSSTGYQVCDRRNTILSENKFYSFELKLTKIYELLLVTNKSNKMKPLLSQFLQIIVEKESENRTIVERRSPCKNFLSKVNKFELLSRGLKPDDSSSSSQSDVSSCSGEQLKDDMLRQTASSKKQFLKLREARSKSFGCEKELHSKKKRPKKPEAKKHSAIEAKLNYIDDEASQPNDNLSDDYDDNVIYEGDSADELNDSDFDSFSSDDSAGGGLVKCRSAPTSPAPAPSPHSQDTCAHFIYDVNLYNDQHNLLILNSQDEFEKNLKKKFDKSSSTESCSSISSSVRLEPLVINEESSAQLSCTNSSNKITVVAVHTQQSDLARSTSSSSSSERKDSSSMSDSIKDVHLEADDSLGSKCDEDSSSLTDEQSSSSHFSTESQCCLKDGYEKAKREREIEQQLAEMEKKRLQEILDICIEFQKQEQCKQVAEKTGSPNNLSPKQTAAVTISELPSLNTVLNCAKSKNNQTGSSRTLSSANKEIPYTRFGLGLDLRLVTFKLVLVIKNSEIKTDREVAGQLKGRKTADCVQTGRPQNGPKKILLGYLKKKFKGNF